MDRKDVYIPPKLTKNPFRMLHTVVDIAAINAAIELDANNGLTEGNLNRLKNIKRQMYGRASFNLLRRKVVLSVTG